MTKQEYLRKQRELIEAKWQAYDEEDYKKADEIQTEIEALVDPEPDELLGEDEGFPVFDEDKINKDDVGSYEDVECKHIWMKGTY